MKLCRLNNFNLNFDHYPRNIGKFWQDSACRSESLLMEFGLLMSGRHAMIFNYSNFAIMPVIGKTIPNLWKSSFISCFSFLSYLSKNLLKTFLIRIDNSLLIYPASCCSNISASNLIRILTQILAGVSESQGVKGTCEVFHKERSLNKSCNCSFSTITYRKNIQLQ